MPYKSQICLLQLIIKHKKNVNILNKIMQENVAFIYYIFEAIQIYSLRKRKSKTMNNF